MPGHPHNHGRIAPELLCLRLTYHGASNTRVHWVAPNLWRILFRQIPDGRSVSVDPFLVSPWQSHSDQSSRLHTQRCLQQLRLAAQLDWLSAAENRQLACYIDSRRIDYGNDSMSSKAGEHTPSMRQSDRAAGLRARPRTYRTVPIARRPLLVL